MSESTSTSPAVRARILIVDDHPNTGATLARILGGMLLPADILTALNGQEALANVGEGVDVLIVDYLMPDMTGLELIERLRALPIRQPVRTILISAHHNPELVELSQRIQVDDYLIKPVYPKQIRGLVEQVLRRPHPLCATGAHEPDGADATGASAPTQSEAQVVVDQEKVI